MASAATLPQQDTSKIGRPAEQGQQPQTQEDPLEKFRALGQQIMQMQNQYPEGATEATEILRAIQKWMTKTAATAQRSQEKQSPPIA